MPLSPNPPLSSLVAEASAKIVEKLGQGGQLIHAAAPGRVNLIGEHIDYCDGFVLPFAIERYTVIAGRLNGTNKVRLGSADSDASGFAVDELLAPLTPMHWTNYLRGVIRGFQDRGHEIPGFDAWIASSVPLGAGLSSSAALESATATLLEGLLGVQLDTQEKALLAQKAEHDFAGVPCGIMDQFASCFGEQDHLILIDCMTETPSLVPFSNPELTVLISNTKVHHELADGEYGKRRKDTEVALAQIGKKSWREVSLSEVEQNKEQLGELVYRRARHVVTEIERTQQAVGALKNENYERLGSLMAASHESLRNDFEVSCKELDLLVDIAAEIGSSGGVIGSRMTGGGFGGSTVTLCNSDYSQKIAQILSTKYEEETGITPEIFASRPSRGAHLI